MGHLSTISSSLTRPFDLTGLQKLMKSVQMAHVSFSGLAHAGRCRMWCRSRRINYRALIIDAGASGKKSTPDAKWEGCASPVWCLVGSIVFPCAAVSSMFSIRRQIPELNPSIKMDEVILDSRVGRGCPPTGYQSIVQFYHLLTRGFPPADDVYRRM